MLQLQLFFKSNFALMKSAELVDLVLVFSPNLDLVAAGRSLVFFR